MTQDLILVLLLSLIPTCLSYLLDYCLGQPGSDEPKIGEIFSPYTIWMAKKTLMPGRLHEIETEFAPMMKDGDPMTRVQAEDQMNLTILEEAKKLFHWQKAVGMCIFCTNVWISILCSFVFFFFIPLVFCQEIFYFLLIPIFSHTILRKL